MPVVLKILIVVVPRCESMYEWSDVNVHTLLVFSWFSNAGIKHWTVNLLCGVNLKLGIVITSDTHVLKIRRSLKIEFANNILITPSDYDTLVLSFNIDFATTYSSLNPSDIAHTMGFQGSARCTITPLKSPSYNLQQCFWIVWVCNLNKVLHQDCRRWWDLLCVVRFLFDFSHIKRQLVRPFYVW